MTDCRERAIKDVAEAFDVNERVVSARLKVAANCECYIDVHTKYAVAQREARLRLEDELKQARKDAIQECIDDIEDEDDPSIQIIVDAVRTNLRALMLSKSNADD